MKLTEKKVKWFKQIIEQMCDVGYEYYKIEEVMEPTKVKITGFDADTFEATCYHMYSEGFGCEHEQIDHCIDIPYEHLYNPDWQNELRESIFNSQMEAIRVSEEKKAEAEAQEQLRNRRLYEQLKKQFEPINTTNDQIITTLNNQQQLGADFKKVLDDNYWDLVRSDQC